MTELRQVNKQEFLRELKYRVENEEITEEEIIILMRSYLLKEEEEMNKQKESIRRGDIYWVRFGKTVGTEIRDPHPVIANYKESKIMCEQIKSVSKKRLSENIIGVLPPELLAKVEIKVKKVDASKRKNQPRTNPRAMNLRHFAPAELYGNNWSNW
ncbi:12602_t:CDS:2 [Racocetra persica]|uniref:12602_t:CDS:1 n=1 Tax=Racocetra persica TaxID=160502 RepID=A0ACA9M106_9GLOM|nr:12602_t:CDS:2 [Racocetra persica]